jgi:hypothetical protein
VKSITDATWKDAAVIEARSLVARLEDVAGKHAADPATLQHVTLESITRQACKLADTIDRIEEAKPSPRRKRKPAAPSAETTRIREMLREAEARQARADRGGEDPPYWLGFYQAIARRAVERLEELEARS